MTEIFYFIHISSVIKLKSIEYSISIVTRNARIDKIDFILIATKTLKNSVGDCSGWIAGMRREVAGTVSAKARSGSVRPRFCHPRAKNTPVTMIHDIMA